MTAIQITHDDFIERDGQLWMPLPELARRLGFSQSRNIWKLYKKNKAELEPFSSIVETTTEAGRRESIHLNSIGCYIISMLARTKKAAAFRLGLAEFLQSHVEGTSRLHGRVRLLEFKLRRSELRRFQNERENLIRRTRKLNFQKADEIKRAAEIGIDEFAISYVIGMEPKIVGQLLNLNEEIAKREISGRLKDANN